MKSKLFIIFLFSSIGVYGQVTALLDTNNISAIIECNGSLFWNGTTNTFTVPKGSGMSTIYAGNIWIGGIDAGGQLHVAAQTYAQGGADFFYGPIASNYSAAPYISTYNNVWKVNKSTINYHIANYTTGGYVVPASIDNWPGNGNITNGEDAILAPYIDVNSNGTYDPANGDYPDIRGDQAIFFMVNDDKQPHGETGGTKLGIEIHGMAYSFASAIDSALNQTVFVNYKIKNHSVNNYDSVYFGAWTDMDLGCSFDDYVGSDSLLNMYYTYNGDIDDVGCGAPGYGLHPPAQALVFLNYPISSFVYYSNDFTVIGNPVTANQYYNYLKGIWKDSTSMSFGGTGHGGVNPANFMFSGDPVSGTGWTEVGAGNSPSDRRGVMAVGPFSLSTGAELCVDVAYPFARDYVGNNLNSITLLRQRVQTIQSFYNSQGYNCQFLTSVNENSSYTNPNSVYPNPFSSQTTVKTNKIFKDATLTIYNSIGQQVKKIKNISGQTVTISRDNLRSGLYFLRLTDENKTYTNKIVITDN